MVSAVRKLMQSLKNQMAEVQDCMGKKEKKRPMKSVDITSC